MSKQAYFLTVDTTQFGPFYRLFDVITNLRKMMPNLSDEGYQRIIMWLESSFIHGRHFSDPFIVGNYELYVEYRNA